MKVNKVLMLVFVFVGLMSIVSFAYNENNAFMKKAIEGLGSCVLAVQNVTDGKEGLALSVHCSAMTLIHVMSIIMRDYPEVYQMAKLMNKLEDESDE